MNPARYVENLAAALYAVVTSPFASRSRLALSFVRAAFQAPAEPFYQTLAWEDAFPDDKEIALGRIAEYPGNTSLIEIAALCKFIETYHLQRVFEIGTFDGRTTYNLAAHAGTEGRVVTLNLPEEEYRKEWIHAERKAASGYRFHGAPVARRIEEVFCDSRKLDPAPYAGQFDFVFIDGDHESRAVDSDSELALKLLTPSDRGLIAWHDADFTTVQTGIWNFFGRHEWERRAYTLPSTRLAFLFLIDRKPVPLGNFSSFDPASIAASRL